jgi:hypothetical protein
MSVNLNNIMIEVAEAAAEKGWYVVGYHKERSRQGTVPGGHVAVVRDHAPFEDRRCATLGWGLSDIGVNFFSGHYDLTRDEAIESLNERKR